MAKRKKVDLTHVDYRHLMKEIERRASIEYRRTVHREIKARREATHAH